MDENKYPKYHKTYVIGCFVFVVIAFCIGFFSGYEKRDRQAAADNRNILRTVQQLEDTVQRLGTQLNATESQLLEGQRANSDARKTAEGLAVSIGQSRVLLDDSEERLAVIKQQFANIDRANNLAGADE